MPRQYKLEISRDLAQHISGYIRVAANGRDTGGAGCIKRLRLRSPAGITGHPILSEILLSAVEAEASWRLPIRCRAGVEAAPNLHLTGDIRESIVRSINSCGFYMGLIHEH